MLNVGAAPIHLCLLPTDMRKSFHGLSALVYACGERPETGAYYVFVNRRKTHVKILYWDHDGLALWYKRLAKGQFRVPAPSGGRVRLSRRELMMLLEGVTPRRQAKRCEIY
ncbi:MAG: IS66 family insertion sequence element accessory protein TnpB [Desulfuromonadales bacterium]|nr:IS66 family insertion sequence element accessory protein TnpB [Desulfuromonadales bacterium]